MVIAKACSPLCLSVSILCKRSLIRHNAKVYITTFTRLPHFFASELVGFIIRKDIATSKNTSQKIKINYHG